MHLGPELFLNGVLTMVILFLPDPCCLRWQTCHICGLCLMPMKAIFHIWLMDN